MVRLGARGRRGYGKCELQDLRAMRFALTNDREWLAWLATALQDDELPPGLPAHADLPGAAATAWPAGEDALAAAVKVMWGKTKLNVIKAQLPIHFRGGVLIATPGGEAAGADTRHIRSGGKPVLTGTALGGVLRQRAVRIGRAVLGPCGDRAVEDLFGSPPPARGGHRAPQPLCASRLTAEEVAVDGTAPLQVTRVALDTFTQATIESALLEEVPEYGGTTVLELMARLPEGQREADRLAGLFVLLVKDLLLGDIPIGGTTGAGRGAMEPIPGRPVIIERSGKTWSFDPDGAPPAGCSDLDGWVASLAAHEARSEPRNAGGEG
jgi:hypothetical protein